MIHSILVPLDGSEFGEQALLAAAAIAQRTGATLRLAHVHVSAAMTPFAGSTPVNAEHEERLRDAAATYIEELAREIEETHRVPATPVILDGSIVDALARYAQESNVDLITMTTHGRGGISRAWLGSVADGLVRQAQRPVVLIRPTTDLPDRLRQGTFQRVLIPLDGSEAAEQVIPYALAVAGPAEIEIRLLQVVLPVLPHEQVVAPYAVFVDHTSAEQRVAEAETYLHRRAEELKSEGVAVTPTVVIHGQPALAILEEADREGIDLIAMATHGRGGVARLVLGSVADKVLRGGSAPLLLLRPDETWGARAG